MDEQAAREAQFVAWVERDNYRREVRRLKQYLSRLDGAQFATAFMIWLWTGAMFVGYQVRPDLVPASVAGVVTAVVIFGGGLILWHLFRLKRERRRQLEAARARLREIEEAHAAPGEQIEQQGGS